MEVMGSPCQNRIQTLGVLVARVQWLQAVRAGKMVFSVQRVLPAKEQRLATSACYPEVVSSELLAKMGAPALWARVAAAAADQRARRGAVARAVEVAVPAAAAVKEEWAVRGVAQASD
jgi:hypothetical protein